MKLKKFTCGIAAVLLTVSCLFAGGCSTPDVALTVDGKVYEMGDYLAYMYATMFTDQQAYLYLSYYGEDALSQKVTYGEDAKEMTLKEYIIQTTKDTMIRQKALENLMEKYSIKWEAEELKKLEEDIAKLSKDQFLPLGFTNERYINMYKAVSLNESTLFTGLYDDGGLREVSDADERKYFDENYLSYKIIEFSLMDDKGAALSDAETEKINKQLQGYLDAFNKTDKTGADFDEVYRQYLKDTKKEDTTTTTTTSTTTTTTTTTTATTTATTTTTTATGNKEEDKTTTTDKKEEEKLETATRNDVVIDQTITDEELIKAIQSLKEGEAAIKTYKANGTTKMAALILRMDPEAEREKDVDFYKDSHQQTIQFMKYEEFDKEVKETADALLKEAVFNNRAIKAGDPAQML